MSYPLNVIEGKIKVLRLLSGLPLILDKPKEKVRTTDILKLSLTLAIAGIVAIMVPITPLLEYQGQGGLDGMLDVLGYSMIDVVTYDLGNAFSAIAAGLLFVAFVKQRTHIAELCGQFESIAQKLPQKNANICSLHDVRCTVKPLALLIVVAWMIQTAANYFSYIAAVPTGGSIYAKLYYVTTSFWLYTCCLFHPLILGGCLVCLFLLSFLTNCYEEYYLQLTTSSGDKLKKSMRKDVNSAILVAEFQRKMENEDQTEHQLGDLISLGQTLCRITEKVNKTLGPFLLILVALSTSAGTSLMYGLAGVMFQPYLLHKILYAIAMGVTGFVYFLALYYLCSTGHKLEEIRKRTREALACKLRACYPLGDPVVKYEGTVLDTRLGEENPLSPLGFFGINNSGFLAAMSIIFTYLLILIGFRDNASRCASFGEGSQLSNSSVYSL